MLLTPWSTRWTYDKRGLPYVAWRPLFADPINQAETRAWSSGPSRPGCAETAPAILAVAYKRQRNGRKHVRETP